jgi:glycosyltransferase involved in cell wall biosynthesis
MHVLVTADTVGGVWTYTRELVSGLVARGVRVTLVSFGGIPGAAQVAWIERLRGVAYFPTGFRLEWMREAEGEIEESMRYLREVVAETRPDLLHLSQFCYGALPVALPKIVVAHSDVMSWCEAVDGRQPQDGWARWYRQTVSRGLAGADMVIAPSRWMLHEIERIYGGHICGAPARSQVIYNGRTPLLFNALVSKHGYAASVGRLWDEGKQARLLTGLSSPAMPIMLAGATSQAWEKNESSRKTETEGVSETAAAVKLLGERSEGEMRELLSRASVYIAASRYEPFGLAPLEAALSRCAILANDIPSLREIWGDAALYFRTNDAASLAELLARLHGDHALRLGYANRAYQRALSRYTAARMVEEYMSAYGRCSGAASKRHEAA